MLFKCYAHSAGPKLGGLDDGRAGGGEGFGSDLGESGGDVERSGCPLAPLDSWGYIKGIRGAGGEGGWGGMYRSSCLDCVQCYQYDLWE